MVGRKDMLIIVKQYNFHADIGIKVMQNYIITLYCQVRYIELEINYYDSIINIYSTVFVTETYCI